MEAGTTSLKEFADAVADEEEAAIAAEQAELGVEPGDQGIATQEDDPDPDYVPSEPTEDEVAAAQEVLSELRGRAREIGAERTIEALLQVVDTHPEFFTPQEWPGEEDEEYLESDVVQNIASILIAGCPRLQIPASKVSCLWRNKEKWTSRGQTVRSKAKPFDTRTAFLTGGTLAAIEVNFHDFKTRNPLQKVFVVYRALRQISGEGKRQAPDFEAYFDELELFGPKVFKEMVTFANALDRGKERDLPYQLSLLDEIDGGE